MTRPTRQAADPLTELLNQAWSLHQQLAARLPPEQAAGGRRPQPGSRPPLQVQMVSHMADLEQYINWWIAGARWRLNPTSRVDLTARTGVRCPTCGADLIAWLRPEDPAASEIVCTGLDHEEDQAPRRWPESEWKRLGVLAGVHDDGRFGPRLDVPV